MPSGPGHGPGPAHLAFRHCGIAAFADRPLADQFYQLLPRLTRRIRLRTRIVIGQLLATPLLPCLESPSPISKTAADDAVGHWHGVNLWIDASQACNCTYEAELCSELLQGRSAAAHERASSPVFARSHQSA